MKSRAVAGLMERQMGAHIVPRASRTDTTASLNARSASYGPPSPMAFDPAAAASAPIGEEEDGLYVRAGQSPKKKGNSPKAGGGSRGTTASSAAWPTSTASMPSKFAPEQPPSMGGRSSAAPSINALSAPARSSALAHFASEAKDEEDHARNWEEHAHVRSKQTLTPPTAATFVLQDPEDQDSAGLRAYSGRSQLDIAAKRALVDLRLDPSSGTVCTPPCFVLLLAG